MFSRYKKQFLVYLNKEDFDFSAEIIDPFEFHSIFVIMAKLFNVMDSKEKRMWMYISPICVFISASSAATICFISLLEYLRTLKIHLVTEIGSYFLVMISKLLIFMSIQCGKKYYHRLLQALRKDFYYACTKGIKYRERFFEHQRMTFKLSVLLALFVGNMGTSMSFWACLGLIYVMSMKDSSTTRPLPFPFWLFGYDLHATPVYEILFISSILFTLCHVYQYAFLVMTQIIWVREITCKADMITWNLQDLLIDVSPAKNREEAEYYNALIKHRMHNIVMMHQSMTRLIEDYAATFKYFLFYEQAVASPVICMTAFCFAEKLKTGEVQLILALLCVTVIVVLLIPSYFCTHLLEKVQSINDACWDIPFWNAGPVVKAYLVLMMMRSMRPLPLGAAGFSDISLQTYSTIITRAYSCFNMLRQADLNIS